MSANNAHKVPVVAALNDFASGRIASAMNLFGKRLPASVVSIDDNGYIVTVKFELSSSFTIPQVQMALAGPRWIRNPVQIGDMGVVRPGDVPLGGVTGLGSGTATLVTPANLASLVFEPVGNAQWPAPPDLNAALVEGVNGVVLQDSGGVCTFKLTPTGIVIKIGSTQIQIDATGLTVTGNLKSSSTTALAGGAKKVVLDGDPVVGGVVVASSTGTTAT